MMEVREVAHVMSSESRPGVVVSTLFAARRILGYLLGWDRATSTVWKSSVSERVPLAVLERSLVPTGTRDGPFSVVYVLAEEAVSEVRNATVEAYLVWSLRPSEGGSDLYWAIHVLPTGGWTRPYLALIRPFRRFIVYPRLLSRYHEAWMGRMSSSFT